MVMFKDRVEAGQKLAQKLLKYAEDAQAIVIGLPRGGVVVAYHCAQALRLSWDLIAVRKVGMPWQPECALGAVGHEGTVKIDQRLVAMGNLEKEDLHALIKDQQQEAQRRMQVYRPERPPLDLKNKKVILVDDGIATGATMEVAVKVVRKMQPESVIVAVPVLPKDAVAKFAKAADELSFVEAPEVFYAVGEFYQDFEQVTDEQVIALMNG